MMLYNDCILYTYYRGYKKTRFWAGSFQYPVNLKNPSDRD